MVTIENYKKRLIEKKLNLYLDTFGAILLYGPKFIGKTTTAEQHCASVVRILDPANNFSTRTLAMMSPDLVLDKEKPSLIDEWQEVPQIWDAIRAEVDKAKAPGQYILTGSNIPLDSENRPVHSGAGRIASIYLNSMSLYEMGDSTGQISLQSLFDNPVFKPVKVWDPKLTSLIRFCVRGGWPATLTMQDIDQEKLIAVQYLKRVVDEDINRRIAKNKRNTRKIESIFYSVAKNEHSVNSVKDCLDLLDLKGEKVSRNTLQSYLNIMEMIFLIKEQPAFLPVTKEKTTRTVLKTSKFRFVDPSLVVAALQMEPDMLLKDIETLGHVFDNLCVHELEVYADAIDARVYHYRDSRGAFADAVVQLKDGRWGAFMHRLAVEDNDAAATELLKLSRYYESVGYPPSLLCIISGMEQAAYVRKDGVVVVPITALKP